MTLRVRRDAGGGATHLEHGGGEGKVDGEGQGAAGGQTAHGGQLGDEQLARAGLRVGGDARQQRQLLLVVLPDGGRGVGG